MFTNLVLKFIITMSMFLGSNKVKNDIKIIDICNKFNNKVSNVVKYFYLIFTFMIFLFFVE